MIQPTFMAEDIPNAAPGLGELKEGSEILVLQPMHHRRWTGQQEPDRAVVTSKARIWITAEQPYGLKSWRLRLDSQTDGSESSYAVRFYTPEQWRFHQVTRAASDYLTSQGIRIEYNSPWKTDSRTIKLARIMWFVASNVDSEVSGINQ